MIASFTSFPTLPLHDGQYLHNLASISSQATIVDNPITMLQLLKRIDTKELFYPTLFTSILLSLAMNVVQNNVK